MESVRAAVIAVCTISAVKCIIGSIAAASKLKGQIAFMLDLILAVVMLLPIVNGFREFSFPEISDYRMAEYDSTDDVYAASLIAQTEKNVEDVLREQIMAVGISCEKIEAEVNIFADHSISITKVTVTSEDFEAASEIVKNSLGSETEVINGAV